MRDNVTPTQAESPQHIWHNDLFIEAWPSRASGHVPHMPRGIKITHEPSGLVAIAGCARSQHANRQIALDMIEAGLTNPRIGR